MADEPTAAVKAHRDEAGAEPGAAGEAPKKPVDPDFEPEIIVFACHYCAYAAADLAGSMRLQYPSTIRMIKLPCTGKLEVIHLLRALEAGADGVYAAGCLEGECHYLKGNLWARKRVDYVKKLLAEVGLEPERVEMYNMSSAMGARFAEVATEFTERIKGLGPNPARRDGVSPLAAAREAAKDVALPDDQAAASPTAASTEKGPAE
jgi:F420-non-reducing hydrogenase iron-sulfur subunit